MALFTDGPISDAAELQRYENDILSVASTENIELGAKMALAQQDLANEVALFLLRRSLMREASLVMRSRREVSDVVVNEPLRQWHAHKTLALVYRDAYNNQLNDRYQGKWKEYERLATSSKATYFQLGIGLVGQPVPKAAPPTLSSATGSGVGGDYAVAVTWVNAGGQEGAPSDLSELTTSNGQQLIVAVGAAPENAVGWNVYVGLSPAAATLQNQLPIAGEGSWTMTSGPNPGAPLPKGQVPTWFIVDHRVIERG
jgi:hypothetical protein